MKTLSVRCPIGFEFEWDGDCPGQPTKTWRFEGRGSGGVPLFSESGCVGRWSARLEEVAQAAYVARVEARCTRGTIRSIVEDHLSCLCSATSEAREELIFELELREMGKVHEATQNAIGMMVERLR